MKKDIEAFDEGSGYKLALVKREYTRDKHSCYQIQIKIDTGAGSWVEVYLHTDPKTLVKEINKLVEKIK
jgi:hypothetical protein